MSLCFGDGTIIPKRLLFLLPFEGWVAFLYPRKVGSQSCSHIHPEHAFEPQVG